MSWLGIFVSIPFAIAAVLLGGKLIDWARKGGK